MSISDYNEEKRKNCNCRDFVFCRSGDFEIWNCNESDSGRIYTIQDIYIF